MEYVKLR